MKRYEELPRFQKIRKRDAKDDLSKRAFKNLGQVYNECESKKRFRDLVEAKNALQLISLDPRDGKPCRAYFCIFCNGFHLTKQDKIGA